MFVAVSKGIPAGLLQQNPPVLNWGYQIMQIVQYNGCKMVFVIAAVVAVKTKDHIYRITKRNATVK